MQTQMATAGWPAFICGIPPTLFLSVFTGHAGMSQNIGINKISAPAKISLIFAKPQKSISLVTGVLSKNGKIKK
jgi:hypothetical protein